MIQLLYLRLFMGDRFMSNKKQNNFALRVIALIGFVCTLLFVAAMSYQNALLGIPCALMSFASYAIVTYSVIFSN